MNFDHCAILASLHPPQVALQRRCSEGDNKKLRQSDYQAVFFIGTRKN
jgi:hypothetical protein